MSTLTQFSLTRDLFSSHVLVMFLLLIFSFNLWWSGRMLGIISIFLYLLVLASCQCAQFWRKFHEEYSFVRSRYTLLCLEEMFCNLLLGLFGLSLSSSISVFSFCLNDMSIGKNSILKSSNYQCVIQAVVLFLFIKLGAFVFGVYKLRTENVILVTFSFDEYVVSFLISAD